MYRAGRGSVRSPHTLSHAGQQPLQRLRSELVSAEPEVPDDTSASARVDTPAPQLVRPRVVRQRVQLDLRLQPHLLRERSVSRNELQRPRRHLVLLKHLSLEVVPHHPRVHKRRRQTHRLRKPLHRLASRRQALCQILHRRHVACVLCCAVLCCFLCLTLCPAPVPGSFRNAELSNVLRFPFFMSTLPTFSPRTFSRAHPCTAASARQMTGLHRPAPPENLVFCVDRPFWFFC